MSETFYNANALAQAVGSVVSKCSRIAVGVTEIAITTDRGVLRFYHNEDCCESVAVEDVTGDPADLIGATIVLAEERTIDDPPGYRYNDDSHTWTFYEIRTTRSDITLRWLGTSNGYYSESVDVSWVSR